MKLIEEAIKLKKDPANLQDKYNPKSVELFWHKYWEQKGYFKADSSS